MTGMDWAGVIGQERTQPAAHLASQVNERQHQQG